MSKAAIIKASIIVGLLLAAVLLSACMREPGVCNYNKICEKNETDNCIDCKDVLGRDVKDSTGNVIYVDNYLDKNV